MIRENENLKRENFENYKKEEEKEISFLHEELNKNEFQ